MFPPKTDIGTTNLIDRIARMSSLNPAWVHVTWGAGGSTQDRSLDLAGATTALGLECCLHLTCTNMEQSVLDRTLEVSCFDHLAWWWLIREEERLIESPIVVSELKRWAL